MFVLSVNRVGVCCIDMVESVIGDVVFGVCIVVYCEWFWLEKGFKGDLLIGGYCGVCVV